MSSRLLVLLAFALLSFGCSSPNQLELDLRSSPAGAEVYLSRLGRKTVQAKVGPVKGRMKTEELAEEFLYLGTSPLEFATPLSETESDATVLGVGGRVVLEYEEGILRFEKPGFETVERRIRIQQGELKVVVDLPVAADPTLTSTAAD